MQAPEFTSVTLRQTDRPGGRASIRRRAPVARLFLRRLFDPGSHEPTSAPRAPPYPASITGPALVRVARLLSQMLTRSVGCCQVFSYKAVKKRSPNISKA